MAIRWSTDLGAIPNREGFKLIALAHDTKPELVEHGYVVAKDADGRHYLSTDGTLEGELPFRLVIAWRLPGMPSEKIAAAVKRAARGEFDHLTYAGSNITVAQIRADVTELAAELERARCCFEWGAARVHHVDCPLMLNDSIGRAEQWRQRFIAADAALERVLGMSNQWPLHDVLARLVEATDHLLDVHNCDDHGHEGKRVAARKGEGYIEIIERAAAAREGR